MPSIPQEVTVPHFVGNRRIAATAKPVPQPGPGQLLIQVQANALCGSERGQFADGTDVTPGHEAAGIVVAAGPGTTTPVGTPGAIFLMDFCGECRSCRLGFTNQCLAKRGDMGFNRDGGYGVYELDPREHLLPGRRRRCRPPRRPCCWTSWAPAATRSAAPSWCIPTSTRC